VKLRHCGRMHRVNIASVSALMQNRNKTLLWLTAKAYKVHAVYSKYIFIDII
jgi:hypothetical protein